MKCVCPMGGDRTCPEDCPLAVWAGLSVADRKAQRKPVAEKLYRQNFTMEQIARQLGVSTETISQDLRSFQETGKPPRPKGGRPRGSTRPPEHYTAAAKALDEGKSRVQVAAETGLSEHVVQLTREREIGRREMLAELLDAAASKNFTEKGALRIEDAIRIHQARLNKAFEHVVNTEVRRRIDAADDATRKQNSKLRKENLQLEAILSKRAPLTKVQFRQMQILCHPDGSASERTKADLLQWLVEHERRLTGGLSG